MCSNNHDVENIVDKLINSQSASTMTTHELANANKIHKFNNYYNIEDDCNHILHQNEFTQQLINSEVSENEIEEWQHDHINMEQGVPCYLGTIAEPLQSQPWKNFEESVGDSLDEVVEHILLAHSCEESDLDKQSELNFNNINEATSERYHNPQNENKPKYRPRKNERLLLHQHNKIHVSQFQEEQEEEPTQSSFISTSDLPPCALPVNIEEVQYQTSAPKTLTGKYKNDNIDNYQRNRWDSSNIYKENSFNYNDRNRENVFVVNNMERTSSKIEHCSTEDRDSRQSQSATTLLNREMRAINSLTKAQSEHSLYSLQLKNNVYDSKMSLHDKKLPLISADNDYVNKRKINDTPSTCTNEPNLSRREMLLLQRLELWEKRKEIRRVNALYQHLEQEKQQCTFKPNVLLSSSSAMSTCHLTNTTSNVEQKEKSKSKCRTRPFNYNNNDNNSNANTSNADCKHLQQKSPNANHIIQVESSGTKLNSCHQLNKHTEITKMCDSGNRRDVLAPSMLYANNKAWGFDEYVLRMTSARAQRERRKAEERAEVAKLTDPSNFDRRVTVPVPFSFHAKNYHCNEASKEIEPMQSDNLDKRDGIEKVESKEKSQDETYESRENVTSSKSARRELKKPESRCATRKAQDDVCSALNVVSSKIRQRLLFAPEMTAVLRSKYDEEENNEPTI